MQIGRKIYYELATGNILMNTGERAGDVVETTEAQDYELFTALHGVSPAAVGVLHLDYGQHANDFVTATGVHIDTATQLPVFDFTPAQQAAQAAQLTLEQKVTKLEADNKTMQDAINALLGL